MPLNSVVVTSTLPQADLDTVDLVSSGFGTVNAALIFMSGANTSNNPATNLSMGVALWDGETVNSISVFSDNGEVASDTARYSDDDSLKYEWMDFSVSAIEDGIRITKNSGSISVNRYISAKLLTGVQAKCIVQNLGTGTSEVDITGAGFEPNCGFVGCIGHATKDVGTTQGVFSFGAFHKNSSGVITQRSAMISAVNAVAPSDADRYMSDQYVVGQHFQNALNWGGEVTSVNSDGIGITPNTNAGNDAIFCLLLKTPNPDDFHLSTHKSPTSTGDQQFTDFGLTPQTVSVFGVGINGLNNTQNSAVIHLGMADGTTTASYQAHDEHGQATTDSDSKYSDSLLAYIPFGSGSVDGSASLSSLDADGMTLNWSNATSTERYMFVWAFGNANGERMVMPTVRPIFSNTVKPTVRT